VTKKPGLDIGTEGLKYSHRYPDPNNSRRKDKIKYK
jgi:hypothetical protein